LARGLTVHLPRVPDPRDLPRLAERAGAFVDEMVGLVPRVAALVGSAETLLGQVQGLLDRIEVTRAAADEVVTHANATRQRADHVAVATEHTVGRATALLDALEPSLTRLRPTLERFAETTDPAEVEALVALVDTLQTVGPDLRELLDIASELNEVLGRVPGMGRIKKRVEEEQAADELDPVD
jgi:ABC-type transporter Mla subunit MlaD